MDGELNQCRIDDLLGFHQEKALEKEDSREVEKRNNRKKKENKEDITGKHYFTNSLCSFIIFIHYVLSHFVGNE